MSAVFRQMPKASILRSEPYRRYVSSQECFGCRLEGFSQAAHQNAGKGMSMKVSDALIYPLCGPHFGSIGCHMAHDLALDGLTRDERRAQAVRWVEQMQARAVAAGWQFTQVRIIAP